MITATVTVVDPRGYVLARGHVALRAKHGVLYPTQERRMMPAQRSGFAYTTWAYVEELDLAFVLDKPRRAVRTGDLFTVAWDTRPFMRATPC